MDVALMGGAVNTLRSLASAAPTLLIGLFIAALMRFYIGPANTKRLFGGDSIRSLPQSWLLGMLLPVCSIGVIPIIREMVRVRARAGAITAFALSAPLFNPLSLLYGLTLSRPYVIVGFAFGSLIVVTLIGLIWDRFGKETIDPVQPQAPGYVGISRLWACFRFMCRELIGPTGQLTLIAVLGVGLLGAILPHGALQTSAEQDDPLAPLRMTLVAVPVYATPMQTISQLGMMFAHGNSPGAAFCLLLLGTGMNVATLWWLKQTYGLRATAIWFASLLVIVVGCAYAIDKPLIPPGVEPAGHTHAFDVYSNPFAASVGWETVQRVLADAIGLPERISLAAVVLLAIIGLMVTHPAVEPQANQTTATQAGEQASAGSLASDQPRAGFDRDVPPVVVGITGLVGLVAFSIVACYAYYPSPAETLEEIKFARTNTLVAANSGNVEEALRWLEVWELWSRRLEVGTAIRHFELRPYQQMQAYLLRKKLELLEHELEHEELEKEEIRALVQELNQTSNRLSTAFRY
ncbi:MAG: permease [Pirellulaceae bacterium]|nr:permease [Pirellulaceae bacterium]